MVSQPYVKNGSSFFVIVRDAEQPLRRLNATIAGRRSGTWTRASVPATCGVPT